VTALFRSVSFFRMLRSSLRLICGWWMRKRKIHTLTISMLFKLLKKKLWSQEADHLFLVGRGWIKKQALPALRVQESRVFFACRQLNLSASDIKRFNDLPISARSTHRQ
jgi:hypothetical protein